MNNEDITRQEAIKKMGKYAALTALGTMIILNPLKAAQSSPPQQGFSGFGGRRKRRSMFNN
tara:strand:+ start:64 stop:246 length:183 start_codon:yes stop_codon:yes gene_type:complete